MKRIFPLFVITAAVFTGFLFAQNSGVETSKIESLYAKNCAMCHGKNLDGGPLAGSLIDDEWTYGNSRESVIEVITNGRPDKAMPAWKEKMTEEEIAAMADWILKQAE